MAGRELEAVERAVQRYLKGESVLAAARAEGISSDTLHRGLKRRDIPRRGPPSGPAHSAYVDGRTAERAAAAAARAAQRAAAKPLP